VPITVAVRDEETLLLRKMLWPKPGGSLRMIAWTSAACIQLVKAWFYPNFSFVTLEKESVSDLQCRKLKLATRTSKQSCISTLGK